MSDGGAWSDVVAKIIKKDHGLFRQHKSANIFSSRGGLSGDTKDEYLTDMNNIIYRNHTEVELDILLEDATVKYGHEQKPRNFIKSVVEKKHKICHTYMKFVFTHGHTTTARGEGQNSAIKGCGQLVTFFI